MRAAPSPRAHTSTPLTCVPELLVPIHGEDDQEVAQDVNDDGEDEEASQSCGDPRRAVQDGVTGFWRGAVQERPIYNHCIQSLNFLSAEPNSTRVLERGFQRRRWWDTTASRGFHLHPLPTRASLLSPPRAT